MSPPYTDTSAIYFDGTSKLHTGAGQISGGVLFTPCPIYTAQVTYEVREDQYALNWIVAGGEFSSVRISNEDYTMTNSNHKSGTMVVDKIPDQLIFQIPAKDARCNAIVRILKRKFWEEL